MLETSVAANALLSDEDAHELLTKSYQNLYAGDFVQVIRLTSRSRTGRAVTRRLQIVRKESEPPGRAVVRFLSPEDIRGTSMLVIEREDRSDDLFVFLPAFRRTKRISSAQRFDSFFGTNLTYEDLEPKQASDFDARLDGHSQVQGIGCVKLRVTPRSGVDSQYDFTVSCIDPTQAVSLWTEYYVKEKLVKRLDSDPSQVRLSQDRFIPRQARLLSMASGFVTEIVTEAHEFRPKIPEHLFTTWNLEGGNENTDLRLLDRSENE